MRLSLRTESGRSAGARIRLLSPEGAGATVARLCGRCGSSAHGTLHAHLGEHSVLLLALLQGRMQVEVDVAGAHERLVGRIHATAVGRGR